MAVVALIIVCTEYDAVVQSRATNQKWSTVHCRHHHMEAGQRQNIWRKVFGEIFRPNVLSQFNFPTLWPIAYINLNF